MRDDFAVFILTHGRPDRVRTLDTLRTTGYTGKVYLVIDDEDKRADEYRARYGDMVVQFCKSEVASRIDTGNNIKERRAIIFARNACWDIAQQLGLRYFIELDDDYTGFFYRLDGEGNYIKTLNMRNTMDGVLGAMVDLMESVPYLLAVCMSQGGDWIGGENTIPGGVFRRKVMNSFVCATDRRFQFVGLINEDVNTYCATSRRGGVFLTILQLMLGQVQTQASTGGMTDIYRKSGTYIKSMYSVMYAPSCVKVSSLVDCSSTVVHPRFHHFVSWDNAFPCIVRESLRKPA
jgi:hypothetical protein